ncbi:LOW QUALITY PROTEIN: hypothetical protein KUTeg_023752 [Tegillarca granosa]|uniref:Uncharacterized protein n=1 Tax=Tegillarca granosa TaxID=220873 RepID=A0ABQ9E342_TEGGR|nr:LOW QUALITY PROTEIN: hypothetical protein KUTeg_023752 [Tegillarca granosa]
MVYVVYFFKLIFQNDFYTQYIVACMGQGIYDNQISFCKEICNVSERSYSMYLFTLISHLFIDIQNKRKKLLCQTFPMNYCSNYAIILNSDKIDISLYTHHAILLFC